MDSRGRRVPLETYIFLRGCQCTFNGAPCRWTVQPGSIEQYGYPTQQHWDMQLIVSTAAYSTTHRFHLYRSPDGHQLSLDSHPLEPGQTEQEIAAVRQREAAEQVEADRRTLEAWAEPLTSARAALDRARTFTDVLDALIGLQGALHRASVRPRLQLDESNERARQIEADHRGAMDSGWDALVAGMLRITEEFDAEMDTRGITRIDGPLDLAQPASRGWFRLTQPTRTYQRLSDMIYVRRLLEGSMDALQSHAPDRLIHEVDAIVERLVRSQAVRAQAVRVTSAIDDLASRVLVYCVEVRELESARFRAVRHPVDIDRVQARSRIVALEPATRRHRLEFEDIGIAVPPCDAGFGDRADVIAFWAR